MTKRRYLAEDTLRGEVEITAVEQGETNIIRTAETWFHPQGGGQKGDRGRIGDCIVLDTKSGPDGTVDHIVDSAEGVAPGMKLPFEVDADFRRANARMHSAGHLIAAVVEDRFAGLTAVSGHHWPGEGRVEFQIDGPEEVTEAEVAALVGAGIAADMPITLQGDPYTDRQCAIAQHRPIPCGGTHLPRTAEIGSVELRGIKSRKGKLRIGYDCP